MKRRTLLGSLLAAPLAARADTYPNKPLRVILTGPVGGLIDISGRAIGDAMQANLGQPWIIDPRPGANGMLAGQIFLASPADGYTLFLTVSGHVALNFLMKAPYDAMKDFQPIAMIGVSTALLCVPPGLPANNLAEFVAYARANPGKLNQGSSGTGALQHLAGEMLAYKAGVKFTHIPYKGGAAALTATLAGEVEMSFTTLLSARPYMQSNRLRILGITAGKRSPAAPELPTIAEGGVPGYEANQWYGVITSAKVPKDIVNKLSLALNAAVNAPDVAERLMKDGSTPHGTTPAQFQAHIHSEIAKWRELIKVAGIRLN